MDDIRLSDRHGAVSDGETVKLDFAVCLPQDAATIALVRGVVATALSSLGVNQAFVDDIRLALGEACNNVIEHAAVEDEYEVRIEVDETNCVISVKNTGIGFDATALAGVMPDVSSPRGRGVAIMRAVMDQVEFLSEPETGTMVHLVKNLGAASPRSSAHPTVAAGAE